MKSNNDLSSRYILQSIENELVYELEVEAIIIRFAQSMNCLMNSNYLECEECFFSGVYMWGWCVISYCFVFFCNVFCDYGGVYYCEVGGYVLFYNCVYFLKSWSLFV